MQLEKEESKFFPSRHSAKNGLILATLKMLISVLSNKAVLGAGEECPDCILKNGSYLVYQSLAQHQFGNLFRKYFNLEQI